MKPFDLSRRQVLSRMAASGIGAGLASFIGIQQLTKNAVAFPESQRIQSSSGLDLRVDWRETYNGQVLEGSDFPGETSDAPPGPVISLDNILPGDRGTLVVQVQLAETADPDAKASVSMFMDSFGFSENGRNEPERTAGDSTPTLGEVQDYLQMSIWYDVGVIDQMDDRTGACNGERDLGDMVEPVIAEGPLGTPSENGVAATLAEEGVQLDPTPKANGSECFSQGTFVCIGLQWALPQDLPGVDDNIIQGDSVKFTLGFGARQCNQNTGQA